MTTVKQQIRFCATDDGGRIAMATVGKGPPLLRAGHWPSHVELDARSPVWMHWLRELSRGHTYIRYDQRGCGLSDAAPASLSLEAWTGDLEAVANALDLERFALFGMSEGGAIAMAYAARHPERVSHLVLLGTPVRGTLRRDGTAEQQEEAEVLLSLARIGWRHDNPAFRQVFTTLFMPDGTPEQHHSLNGLVRVSTSPENAVAIHEASYQLDITALAKAVHVPTLVLHAHGDAIIPFEEGRQLATLIRSARFVPLDSRNHILLETEPAWAQFLTEVRAFLGDGADAAGVSRSLADALTRSELQVLGLLARGHQNAAIAAQLGKREKTVRNQVSSILSKLGARTRAEAVARARDAGIGTPRS
jgi:pimeloyl-ACP methyl ester carboxylesterase/DNA-binding CsgD family transcriptional regulator